MAGVEIITREGQGRSAVYDRAMQTRALLGKMGGEEMVNLQPLPGKRSIDVPEILRQIERGQQELGRRWPDMCDAIALTMPDREAYGHNKRTASSLEMSSSVGGMALAEGVSNVIDTIMPPERAWMKFQAGGRVAKEARSAYNRAIEPWTDRFFEEIHASNHAQESLEMGYELYLGLGPMILNKGTYENPFEFSAVPMWQVTPVKGPKGAIETVHHKTEIPVGHVLRKYPVQLEALPREWQEAYRKDKDSPVEIVDSTVYQPSTDDYVRCLIDPKTKTVVWHVVSISSPWIIPEWERVAGQMYARGPLNIALADLRMMNESDADAFMARRIRGRPPIEVMGMNPVNPFTLRMLPGAVHYTNPRDSNPTIRPFDLGVEPQWSQDAASRLETRVKDALLASEFLAPPGEANNVTATEVMLRRQVAINKRGANYGRLQGGYLYQLARRGVHILSEFGMFPAVRVNNRAVRLQYVGPLQQARDATEVDNVHQWARRQRDTLGSEQAFLTNVAVEEISEWDAEKSGVPARFARNEGQRAIMQKSLAQIATAGAQQG